MVIFPFVSLLLIIFLLMAMMAKARPFGRVAMTGKTLKTVPLGFLQKMMLHRSSLLALAFGLVWGIASGWLQAPLAALFLALTFVILFLPMKYTFTSKGVAVGDGIFREWNEFSGISRQGAQIILHHPSFFGRLTLFTRSAEADGLFSDLQRYVKSQSYPKGAEAK
jgi:hypothetical protein